MPVRRGEPADIDPEVARDRGTYLIAVKRLALDFARFQDILGQRVENSFRAQLKAKAINATDETALPVPDIDNARSNPGAISAESRPSPLLVDMGPRFILRTICVESSVYSTHPTVPTPSHSLHRAIGTRHADGDRNSRSMYHSSDGSK
jgi:hypothetical protein